MNDPTRASGAFRRDDRSSAPPRSYEALVERTWSENILFSVLLELTYRCNLDCFYCYNDTQRGGTPLSLERYRALLDELAELSVLHLTLSGGEPLAHPHFFAIGAHARERGFAVRVKSNGHALRGALARRLKEEVDPFVIDISLHGARSESHDRQTRVPGSFERLVSNLRELTGLGLRVKLNCTLTRWNEEEPAAMIALARSLGVGLAFNTSVTPRDDGDREPLSIAPTKDGLFRLWTLLEEGASDVSSRALEGDEIVPASGREKNCGAGSSSLTVDPYGDVLPCVQWRRPVGNLHRETIRDIWERSAALAEARALTIAAKGTADRLATESAGPVFFCLGLAELATGDPTAPYEETRVQQRLAGEHAASRRGALLPVVR